MQIGVCYQLAFNTESYPHLCQARSRVFFVIGQWQVAHKMVHSQSVQPGFHLRNADGELGGAALFESAPDYRDPPASAGIEASTPQGLRRRPTSDAERARDAALAELGNASSPSARGGSMDGV